MPPKPRGLAASRKQSSSSSASATAATEATLRTAPVDEDHLTISDLFELRASANELTSSSSKDDDDADRQEEARGLLRGILHACEALSSLFPSSSSSSSLESQQKALQLRAALGLERSTAKAHLAYLQAFALHQLAALLPTGAARPSAASFSSAAVEGSRKRRKAADVHEPTTAGRWLDRALEAFALAVEQLQACEDQDQDQDQDRNGRWLALVCAEQARALCDRAALELNQQQQQGGEAGEVGAAYVQRAKELLQLSLDTLAAAKTKDALLQEEDEEAEECDVESALLRALSSLLSLLDTFPSAAGTSTASTLLLLDFLTAALATPNLFDDVFTASTADAKDQGGEGGDERRRREFDVTVLRADAQMAQFLLLEDLVEEKYRPDDGEEEEDVDDDGEEEEGGDEEGEPLPDEEDVRIAKRVGEQAAELLAKSIELFKLLSKKDQDLSYLRAQYRKSEEVWLTISALYHAASDAAVEITRIAAQVEALQCIKLDFPW